VCSDHLISPGCTRQLLHMHEHCPLCSDHLMSPGLTTVLLHMQEHCLCTQTIFYLLVQPHCFCICKSTISLCYDHLISPALTTVPLHMQGHCPVCLLPPAPTTLLLYMCRSIISVSSNHSYTLVRPHSFCIYVSTVLCVLTL